MRLSAKNYALLLLSALLVMGTWLFPATRTIWDQLDLFVFRTLNGSIETFPWTARIWAYLNWRPMDGIPALLIMGILLWHFSTLSMEKVKDQSIRFFLFIAYFFITRQVLDQIMEIVDYGRRSPSLVVENAIRLSQQFPAIDLKDSSRHSFPGDHAMAIFAVLFFLWLYSERKIRWTALLVLLPFLLPRLTAGAHWFTDIFSGSISLAAVFFGLWFTLPLADRLTALIRSRFEQQLTKVFAIIYPGKK